MPLKLLKILLCTTAIMTLIIIIVALFFYTYDWNRARPFVNRQIAASIGRDFVVNGDLKLALISEFPNETAWARYLRHFPSLRISAGDVLIGNPSWSQVGEQMIKAQKIIIILKPWSLLNKNVLISQLELDTPQIMLERRIDGSNSWSIRANEPSNWTVQIQRLRFAMGTLRYLDDGIDLDLRATGNSIASDTLIEKNPSQARQPRQAIQQFDLHFVLDGIYRHAPISGSGKLGSILRVEKMKTAFPVEANINLGTNHIVLNGVVTDPREPSGINVDLALGGKSLSELSPLTGIPLPVTAAYKIHGHLLGQNIKPHWNWIYQNFVGTMGTSDLSGNLQYIYGLPRSSLRGAITSNQLTLDDLGPLIGADSNSKKIARGQLPVQPAKKVLPVEPFHTNTWSALDADVKFSGKHLVRTHDIPLENIVAEIHLHDSVLSLSPLYFGMAGGDITSNIVLDGRSSPIAAQIKMAARNLKLHDLFPKLRVMDGSLGEINGDAALTGHGNSISTMLATSNGEFATMVSSGSVSRYILELAGLNVANVLFVKLFGDKQVRLNCLVGNFGVTNGIAKVKRFVIDTDEAVVNVTGDIDMSRERLNLDVTPDTKGARIFSLHSPLYAKGTFKHPDVGPYKGPLLLRAATTVALALIAPPAAGLATVNMGTETAVDCQAELAKAQKTRLSAKSEVTLAPAAAVSRLEIQKRRTEK